MSNAGRLRGSGSIAGNLVVTGTVYPGATTTATTPGEVFTVNGSANFGTFGGTLRARVSNTSVSVPKADKLMIYGQAGTPISGNAKLELMLNYVAGNYTIGGPYEAVILQTNAATITAPFSSVTYNGSTSPPAGVSIVYRNGLTNVDPIVTPADRVVLTLTGSTVTPVYIDSFKARREAAGVTIEWRCASEYQNLGFNLYRRYTDFGKGPWLPITPSMLPGELNAVHSCTFRFFDWPGSGEYQYKLESVSLSGVKEAFAQLTEPVSMRFSAWDTAAISPEGIDAANASVQLEADHLQGQEYTRAFMALDKAQKQPLNAQAATLPIEIKRIERAVASRAASPEKSSAPTVSAQTNYVLAPRWFTPSNISSSDVAKVVYQQPGVLKVPPEALPAGFDLNRLRVTREGMAVPALAANASGLCLYAPGYSDDYTDKDAFFLSRASQPAAVVQPVTPHGLFDALAANTSTSNATVSFHDVYFDWGLRPYTYPPWFAAQYLSQGSLCSFPVDVPNAAKGAAAVTINLWSLTDANGSVPDHQLQVCLNGTPVGQTQWIGGGKMLALRFDLPAGTLKSGTNKFDLITPVIPGIASSIALLHSISVSYGKMLSGPGPVDLNIDPAAATSVYEVSGMPSANVWVVDARFPSRAALAGYESQAQADGTFKIRFSANVGGTGNYSIVPFGAEVSPLLVQKRTLEADARKHSISRHWP